VHADHGEDAAVRMVVPDGDLAVVPEHVGSVHPGRLGG
jgi:hypothetical protein